MGARTRLATLCVRLAVYTAAVLVVLYAPSQRGPEAPLAAAAEAPALATPPPARPRSRSPRPAPSRSPPAVRIALLAVLAAGIAVELGTRRPAWR